MKKILFLLSCSTILLSSCDKDDDSSSSPNPTTGSGQASVNIVFLDDEFVPSDGKGLLMLNNTKTSFVSPNGTIEDRDYSSSSIAVFYNSLNAGVALNAGTVTMNTDTLVNFFDSYLSFKNDNYFYKGIGWRVTGNSSTGVLAFNYSVTADTPHFNMWNANHVYTKANGISFSLNGGFIKTDTLLVSIVAIDSATNEEIKFSKPYSPKANSITFTSSELSTIPLGEVKIVVKALNFSAIESSNKKYYFLNDFTRMVNAELN